MANDKKPIKKISTARVNIKLPDHIISHYKNKSNELGIPYSNLITLDIVNFYTEREERERLLRNSQYPNYKKR